MVEPAPIVGLGPRRHRGRPAAPRADAGRAARAAPGGQRRGRRRDPRRARGGRDRDGPPAAARRTRLRRARAGPAGSSCCAIDGRDVLLDGAHNPAGAAALAAALDDLRPFLDAGPRHARDRVDGGQGRRRRRRGARARRRPSRGATVIATQLDVAAGAARRRARRALARARRSRAGEVVDRARSRRRPSTGRSRRPRAGRGRRFALSRRGRPGAPRRRPGAARPGAGGAPMTSDRDLPRDGAVEAAVGARAAELRRRRSDSARRRERHPRRAAAARDRPGDVPLGRADVRDGHPQRDAGLVLRRRPARPAGDDPVARGRRHGRGAMVDEGADILDVGGESTRPGHATVDARRGASPGSCRSSRAIRGGAAGHADQHRHDEARRRRGRPRRRRGPDQRRLGRRRRRRAAPARRRPRRPARPDAQPGRGRATRTSSPRSSPTSSARSTGRSRSASPGNDSSSTRASGSARRRSTTSSCCASSTRSALLGRPILLGTRRKSTLGRVLDLPADERLEATLATTALGDRRPAPTSSASTTSGPNVRAARMATRSSAATSVDGSPTAEGDQR